MGDVMKIGGNNNGTVKGVAVESDGRQITTKTWAMDKVTVIESGDISTSSQITNAGSVPDISGYGLISLRVEYKMPGASVTIGFYSDLSDDTSVYLYEGTDASSPTISLPATDSKKVVILTPDDIPFLPYLNYLHVRVTPSDTPTSTGLVNIYAMCKR